MLLVPAHRAGGEAESKNKGHMAHERYCWDFNPCLLKYQVHIHFLSPVESLIQILAFTFKGGHGGGRGTRTHDYRLGNRI